MDDAARVAEVILAKLGPTTQWPSWPGGWPGEIEAALLDAVFSANARYGGSPDTGVRGLVKRWRDQADRPLNDLQALLRDAGNATSFAATLKNAQMVPGRSASRPTKAAAVLATARELTNSGIVVAADAIASNETNPIAFEQLFTRTTYGVGPITCSYFLMLLGVSGVKADRMLRRFVATALDLSEVSSPTAARLITAASGILDAEPTHVDYAVWRYQSGRRRHD